MDGAGGVYKNREIELSLFDLVADPNETTNVIADHPEVAEKLRGMAAAHRKEFYEK